MSVRFKVFAGQASDDLEDQVNKWMDTEEAKQETKTHSSKVDGKVSNLLYDVHIKVHHFHTTLSDELIYLTLTYERVLLRPVS